MDQCCIVLKHYCRDFDTIDNAEALKRSSLSRKVFNCDVRAVGVAEVVLTFDQRKEEIQEEASACH
jgi:hypothetical protein